MIVVLSFGLIPMNHGFVCVKRLRWLKSRSSNLSCAALKNRYTKCRFLTWWSVDRLLNITTAKPSNLAILWFWFFRDKREWISLIGSAFSLKLYLKKKRKLIYKIFTVQLFEFPIFIYKLLQFPNLCFSNYSSYFWTSFQFISPST